MDSTGVQCWCNFLVLLEFTSNSGDLLFPPVFDWSGNCVPSQAFLAWYSWWKHKSGSGSSWLTGGCTLEELSWVFIFLVVWSLGDEDKPPGELDPSSYSMTCSLVLVFLRTRSQSTLKQTAQCSAPRAHQGQKYQALSTGTWVQSAVHDVHTELRPQSSPQTSVEELVQLPTESS